MLTVIIAFINTPHIYWSVARKHLGVDLLDAIDFGRICNRIKFIGEGLNLANSLITPMHKAYTERHRPKLKNIYLRSLVKIQSPMETVSPINVAKKV